MEVEREYERSSAATKSKLLMERWFYGPTYLIDESPTTGQGTGEATVFLHRYRLYVTPKGNLSVRRFLDVEAFPNDDAMVAAIEERDLEELPEDQPPGDWLPPAIAERVEALQLVKAGRT